MRPRIPTALALLAGFAGSTAYAQSQRANPTGPAVPNGPYTINPNIPVPPDPISGGAPFRSAATRPSQPPQVDVGDLPLDTLVAELKAIQAQKAALAKREADVAKEVRRRLGEYTEALDKLGHGPVRQNAPRAQPLAEPDPLPPSNAEPPPDLVPARSTRPRQGTADPAPPPVLPSLPSPRR